MSGSGRNSRRQWLPAVAGGLVLGTVLVVILQSPFKNDGSPVPAVPPVPRRPVELVKPGVTNGALSEQTEMRDTAPLFLPTERNASVALPRREPGKSFLDQGTLKLNFDESGLNLAKTLPPAGTLNGKPVDKARPVDALAADASGLPLLGFGRVPSPVATLPRRGGFVEVVATATGQRVLAEALPAAAAPPTEKEWQPIEFLATVDTAGLVGPLVVKDGSRVEEVDAYFGNFLRYGFRIGARLPPGFYRVIVGP